MDGIPWICKNLGAVVCGQTHTDHVEIENNEKATVHMTVAEDGGCFRTRPNGFVITPERVEVPPKKKATFSITFISHVPDVVYNKKYIISDGSKIVSLVTIRCITVGPSITKTYHNLKFFVLRSTVVNVKRVEIDNQGMCPARFQFDLGGRNGPFQVSETCGIVPPKAKQVLDVRFTPQRQGVYRKKIYCLFQYHQPITFDLTGVYKPSMKVDPSKLCYHYPLDEPCSRTYEEYMRSVNEVLKVEEEEVDDEEEDLDDPFKPFRRKASIEEVENVEEEEEGEKDGEASPVEESNAESEDKGKNWMVLSSHFLDIGSDSTLTKFKMANTSETIDYCFEWTTDSQNYFTISPTCGEVKAKTELSLEIDFIPPLPDRLYHGDIDLRIFHLENESEEASPDVVNLPMTMTLSIIGHSFTTGTYRWLEQCDIEPRELILAPCVPGEVVYSTLMIRRAGHLPTLFKFLPPQDTCVRIKPPLGFIDVDESYRLAVVQFDASGKCDGAHSETWQVQYNECDLYYGSVRVLALVESPRIILGEDNSLDFKTTLPGGMHKTEGLLRNPTGLTLRYDFIIPPHMTWIEISTLSGVLEPLSAEFIPIVFKPEEPREYMDYICCTARSVTMPDYVVAIRFQFRGSCQDGFLVGTPTCHKFGRCLYGSEVTAKFHIFNFTPIFMDFRLFVDDVNFVGEYEENIVQVEPSNASIPGRSNLEIEVKITPKNVELCKHVVMCQLLQGEECEALPCSPPRPIAVLYVEGVLPTLQIIDLQVEGGGPIFSPDWLWRMLNINGLNKLLLHLVPHKPKVLDVRLPEVSLGSYPVFISMLVEGRNLFEVEWEIRNNYYVHVKDGKSSSKIDVENDSFNIMAFAPRRGSLKAKCRFVLKLILTYHELGRTEYEWSIVLSHDRVVILRAEVVALSPEEPGQTSMFLDPEIHLKPVSIGDPTPPMQLFWLYNNTPSPTSYLLDKASLRQATPEFPATFNCLNSNGVIPPFSATPLIFQFSPKELKAYEVATHLCVKENEYVCIELHGSGTLGNSFFVEFSHEPTIPDTPLLEQDYVTIEPTKKVFIIKPFSTFSDEQRIFFLRNTSPNKEWAFHWHTFYVTSIIKAHVEPGEGVIKPGEKMLMKLLLESSYYATSISFSIPCDVIDYSALTAYHNALQLRENTEEKFKDYFTITERGTFFEKPEVEIPEKPEICHIFIAVKTNIVSDRSVDLKVNPRDQIKLQTVQGIPEPIYKQECDENGQYIARETLEKVFWKVIHSTAFENQLKTYDERYGKATYLQIQPLSEKMASSKRKDLSMAISKQSVQFILQDTILEILNRKFNT